jgi:signal transduction histidine kinase
MRKIKYLFFLEAVRATIHESDLLLQQRFRLFRITTLFALLVFATVQYQVTMVMSGHLLMLSVISFLFIAVFINYFAFAFHKKTSIAFVTLVILLFAVLHVMSYGQGGVRNSGMFYLSAIIMIAFMLLGKLSGRIMATVAILHIIYFYFITVHTNWTDYSLIGKDPHLIDLDFLITGILCILVLTSQVNYLEKSKNEIINDINSKKDELLFTNNELLISQKDLHLKNKELEQFAYVASHDLQEPLRTTTSFVDLLQKQYNGKLDSKADIYLDFIVQSSDRMNMLIKDLLDYSRIGADKELVQVDCKELLQQVIAGIQSIIKGESADITIGNLPVILASATELKQLFQNLLTNAIKFKKRHEIPMVKISSALENGFWKFAIEDNGIGIEEQYKDKIFIIFQRLHNRKEYEGSGIGLAHCKKIVELHGGKIWFDSVKDEGTVFYFTMPQ